LAALATSASGALATIAAFRHGSGGRRVGTGRNGGRACGRGLPSDSGHNYSAGSRAARRQRPRHTGGHASPCRDGTRLPSAAAAVVGRTKGGPRGTCGPLPTDHAREGGAAGTDGRSMRYICAAESCGLRREAAAAVCPATASPGRTHAQTPAAARPRGGPSGCGPARACGPAGGLPVGAPACAPRPAVFWAARARGEAACGRFHTTACGGGGETEHDDGRGVAAVSGQS